MPRYSSLIALFLLLAACATTRPVEPRIAAADTDWSAAETVRVTLTNFEFTPETVRLSANRPVRLVLANQAGGGHDFTAPDFFAAASIAPEDAARIAAGQIELEAGEEVSLRLIPASGRYDLVCTHFGHSALGMRGDIVVE